MVVPETGLETKSAANNQSEICLRLYMIGHGLLWFSRLTAQSFKSPNQKVWAAAPDAENGECIYS